jgi:hypothetical protein
VTAAQIRNNTVCSGASQPAGSRFSVTARGELNALSKVTIHDFNVCNQQATTLNAP